MQGDIQEVKMSKSKYFGCFDSRSQQNKDFEPKNEFTDIKSGIITGFSGTFYAILYKRNDILEFLLQQKETTYHLQKLVVFHYKVFKNANQNQKLSLNPQTNILSFAVAVNNKEAVSLILKYQSQLANEVNSIGSSLLQVAVSVNNDASQEILFNQNIVRTQLAAVDERFRNPLYFASLYGRLNIIQKWQQMCQEGDMQKIFVHSVLQLSDNYIKIYKVAELALEDYQSKGTTPELKYQTAEYLRVLYEQAFTLASQWAKTDRVMSQLVSLQLKQEHDDVTKSKLIQSKVSYCVENERGEETDVEKDEDCMITSGILE